MCGSPGPRSCLRQRDLCPVHARGCRPRPDTDRQHQNLSQGCVARILVGQLMCMQPAGQAGHDWMHRYAYSFSRCSIIVTAHEMSTPPSRVCNPSYLVHPSTCLSVCPSVHTCQQRHATWCVRLSVRLSVYLSVCLSVHSSVRVSMLARACHLVCLSVCPSVRPCVRACRACQPGHATWSRRSMGRMTVCSVTAPSLNSRFRM
jgi:hypothetical protein